MKWNNCLLIYIFLSILTEKSFNKKMMTTIYLKEKSSSSTRLLLPSITIDADHTLDSYYPLFLQTHLLKTQSENYNIQETTKVCMNNENMFCEICDKSTMKICHKCEKGFFKLKGKCFNTCPKNFVADIFRRECHPLNERTQITYLKAFTKSSCKNKCGKTFPDCSCELDCATKGTCCSDFHHCESMILNNRGKEEVCKLKEKRLGKCDFCDFTKDVCIQCEDGKYLREGKCVSMCNSSDRVIKQNKICLLAHECGMDYCAHCLPNNNDRCKQCINGYFLFNGQCLNRCPYRYRADRISWQCLDTPIYAWYWLFPTRSSCRGKCNYKISKKMEMDCSCEEDCYRRGNCCQDFEEECPQFIFWK